MLINNYDPRTINVEPTEEEILELKKLFDEIGDLGL